jgi:hypothetical protein
MNEGHQIAPGVFVNHYDLDARFTRGSLEGLAVGVRDAVWKHIELFESVEAVKVFVGGNRKNSLDPPLEVAAVDRSRFSMVAPPPELERRLRAVRARNLPTRENCSWDCTCAVYCDQAHGEGRIELRILKQTFHEMAAVAA